jgi:hypothetical protein
MGTENVMSNVTASAKGDGAAKIELDQQLSELEASLYRIKRAALACADAADREEALCVLLSVKARLGELEDAVTPLMWDVWHTP